MNSGNTIVVNENDATSDSLKSAVGFWVVWVAIAGLYLYALVASIGNFWGMNSVAQKLTGSLSTSGVVWLTAGVVLPLISFGIAVLLGRNRSRPQKLLMLAAGICLLAVMQLNIMHLVPNSSYFG